jgi:phage terminase large subunit GpA-like protein
VETYASLEERFAAPLKALSNAWRAPPRLLISEWAEQYRYLSPEASAEPGLWNNARAPHLVLPMDYLSPYHPCERVVFKSSSQAGKTECLLNFIGYIIDLDPGPILCIQPNITPMGESFSKDRVATMLRDSPSLAEKIGKVKSRSSTSTILHKVFPGGHLTIAGANSPSSLASRPIRYLICDELDRWELTKEGDPLLLARKRLQTFRARRTAKEIIASTPTYADVGICAEYDRCTQQWQWQVACQHCGALQFPRLEHFRWDHDDATTVRYLCKSCGAEHDLKQADKVKLSGRWVCTKDGPETTAGFWFNEWASFFARWDDTLSEWIGAQGDPARKQAVVNTAFGEPWEGEGERAEPHALMQRCEDYGAEVPAEALLLTMGVDVQGDRVELEVVGWGRKRESWSIAYLVLPGEPTSGEVWEDLLEQIKMPYARADGRKMRVAHVCIDSGAYTQHVYEAVKRFSQHNITPIKGAPGMSREEVDRDRRAVMKRRARRARYGKPPEIIGVDQIKLTVFHALSAIKGQPNYCHFPTNRSEEYFLQLTGERLVITAGKNRRPERHWVPVHSAVEALDCRVYAYAALLFTYVDLDTVKVSSPEPETPPAVEKPGDSRTETLVQSPTRPKPNRRRSSFWLNSNNNDRNGLAPPGWSL